MSQATSTSTNVPNFKTTPTVMMALGLFAFLSLVATSHQCSAFNILSAFSQMQVQSDAEAQTSGTPLNSTKSSQVEPPVLVSSTPSQSFNFTVAACVAVKDAEAYFEEWIDYHVGVMKFDQIYLYDHSVDFELQRWYSNSRDDPIYHKTMVQHYKYTGENYNDEKEGYNQNVIYRDCVDRFGKGGPKHDYMAFFDIDEFLVPQDSRYSSIHSILAEYLVPFGGTLVFNWVLFGTANKTVYSPVPVTKRFQYRDSEPHGIIKSIAKTSDYKSHRNPHSVKLLGNATAHTTKYPGRVHQASSATGASDHERPSNVALLYHYRYGSAKEYVFKRCIRGNMDPGTWCDKSGTGLREIPKGREHILPRPGSVYDDAAWELLIHHVPKYRLYDDLGWKDYNRR